MDVNSIFIWAGVPTITIAVVIIFAFLFSYMEDEVFKSIYPEDKIKNKLYATLATLVVITVGIIFICLIIRLIIFIFTH